MYRTLYKDTLIFQRRIIPEIKMILLFSIVQIHYHRNISLRMENIIMLCLKLKHSELLLLMFILELPALQN